MNELIYTMETCLKHSSAHEKNEILDEYREHFAAEVKAVKTQPQIVSELGDPTKQAKMFTAVNANETALVDVHVADGIRIVEENMSESDFIKIFPQPYELLITLHVPQGVIDVSGGMQ